MTHDSDPSGGDPKDTSDPTDRPAGAPAEISIPETGKVTVDPRALPKRLPDDRTIHPRRRLPSVPEGDDRESGDEGRTSD